MKVRITPRVTDPVRRFVLLTQAVDFWSQCIGDTETDMNGFSDQGTTALMDSEASDALGSGREIKQLVQDEV